MSGVSNTDIALGLWPSADSQPLNADAGDSQSTVVGDDRFVSEHHAIFNRRAPADVAVPAENRLPDDGFLADAAIGPDDRALDRCVFFDVTLAADGAVGAETPAGPAARAFIDATRPLTR